MNTLKQKLQLLVILLAMLVSSQTIAQSNLIEMEYGAYLKVSKTLWKTVVEKRENAYSKSKEPSDLFKLASAQHGLLAATMADKDEDLFNKYLDDTKENLEELIDMEFNTAESKALLSAVYGLEMGYSSWKGIYLGSKSSGLIDNALNKDKNSPIVWLVYANSKLFTPAMFGGDKKEAIKAYAKAVSLFENENEHQNNWRYLDALAWLGQAYEQTEQPDKAREVYEKALEVEPDFIWVKHALLPKLAQK